MSAVTFDLPAADPLAAPPPPQAAPASVKVLSLCRFVPFANAADNLPSTLAESVAFSFGDNDDGGGHRGAPYQLVLQSPYDVTMQPPPPATPAAAYMPSHSTSLNSGGGSNSHNPAGSFNCSTNPTAALGIKVSYTVDGIIEELRAGESEPDFWTARPAKAAGSVTSVSPARSSLGGLAAPSAAPRRMSANPPSSTLPVSAGGPSLRRSSATIEPLTVGNLDHGGAGATALAATKLPSGPRAAVDALTAQIVSQLTQGYSATVVSVGGAETEKSQFAFQLPSLAADGSVLPTGSPITAGGAQRPSMSVVANNNNKATASIVEEQPPMITVSTSAADMVANDEPATAGSDAPPAEQPPALGGGATEGSATFGAFVAFVETPDDGADAAPSTKTNVPVSVAEGGSPQTSRPAAARPRAGSKTPSASPAGNPAPPAAPPPKGFIAALAVKLFKQIDTLTTAGDGLKPSAVTPGARGSVATTPDGSTKPGRLGRRGSFTFIGGPSTNDQPQGPKRSKITVAVSVSFLEVFAEEFSDLLSIPAASSGAPSHAAPPTPSAKAASSPRRSAGRHPSTSTSDRGGAHHSPEQPDGSSGITAKKSALKHRNASTSSASWSCLPPIVADDAPTSPNGASPRTVSFKIGVPGESPTRSLSESPAPEIVLGQSPSQHASGAAGKATGNTTNVAIDALPTWSDDDEGGERSQQASPKAKQQAAAAKKSWKDESGHLTATSPVAADLGGLAQFSQQSSPAHSKQQAKRVEAAVALLTPVMSNLKLRCGNLLLGVFVEGAQTISVTSSDELLNAIHMGCRRRLSRDLKTNKYSTAVLQIVVRRTESGQPRSQVATFTFVDAASAFRMPASLPKAKKVMASVNAVKKLMTALSDVRAPQPTKPITPPTSGGTNSSTMTPPCGIAACPALQRALFSTPLATHPTIGGIVRESVLTQLLVEPILGNSQLICLGHCVDPTLDAKERTLFLEGTSDTDSVIPLLLRVAQHTSATIKLIAKLGTLTKKVSVNEAKNDVTVGALRHEIDLLKKSLGEQNGAASSPRSDEEKAQMMSQIAQFENQLGDIQDALAQRLVSHQEIEERKNKQQEALLHAKKNLAEKQRHLAEAEALASELDAIATTHAEHSRQLKHQASMVRLTHEEIDATQKEIESIAEKRKALERDRIEREKELIVRRHRAYAGVFRVIVEEDRHQRDLRKYETKAKRLRGVSGVLRAKVSTRQQQEEQLKSDCRLLNAQVQALDERLDQLAADRSSTLADGHIASLTSGNSITTSRLQASREDIEKVEIEYMYTEADQCHEITSVERRVTAEANKLQKAKDKLHEATVAVDAIVTHLRAAADAKVHSENRIAELRAEVTAATGAANELELLVDDARRETRALETHADELLGAIADCDMAATNIDEQQEIASHECQLASQQYEDLCRATSAKLSPAISRTP